MWGLWLALGIAAVVLAAWLTRHRRLHPWGRVACVASALALFLLMAEMRLPAILTALDWEVFEQAHGAQRVGVAGNLLLGVMTSTDVGRKADPAAVRAFWQEPRVRQLRSQLAASGARGRPDIVVLQSESLFMPSQLCGFDDTPVLPRLASMPPSFLRVPVFGGRTLQTEFEVQSGASIGFYPGSMFAYYELLHQRVDAWPHAMARLGYRTLVIHPNARGYWNRDAAMPQLGFATFIDDGAFLPADLSSRGHVSDLALSQAIMAELDAADRPTYLTAISIDNHGPWGDHPPAGMDAEVRLPAQLHGAARVQMADYLSRAQDADAAFGYLIDALARRGRPAVVAVYGDHLPALPDVYSQLCFKDGRPPEQHWPPYRVWTNLPIQPAPSELPAYLLQGYVMRQTGIPLDGLLLANAIAGMVYTNQTIPAEERKRILAEYDHVAAANLEQPAGPPQAFADAVFIGKQNAWHTLRRMAKPAAPVHWRERDGDVYLRPDETGHATLDLELDRHVASLSLRPYVICDDPQGKPAELAISGDGIELYQARLSSDALRLATLDLRGVNHLALRVSGQSEPGCGVFVRVAQMQRCVDVCTRDDFKPQPTRSLMQDWTSEDRHALKALAPAQRGMVERMRAMQWLMTHETGHQDGYAPLRLQEDGRLFMHPAEDRDAWISFDVSALAAIDLLPSINALDAACTKLGRDAGVVALDVRVDGEPRIHASIDRNYQGAIHVDLTGAHTLQINVNKGNGVSWCDWFSLGVEKLVPRGSPHG